MNEAQKQVAAIVASAHTFKKPSVAIETNSNPKALAMIDEIFIRLKAICAVGNAFKTEREEAIVKQEWMLALREEGVTKRSMIDDGINAIRIKARKNRNTTWFPSISEFIDLCLGSDDKLAFADRAYNLFIRRERQTDSVGRMVTSSHSFELRQMKSAECKKGFIELYLKYSADNEIKPLDAFAITETVELTQEQQKEANDRKQAAQNQFLKQFSGLIADKPEEKEIKPVKTGVEKGRIQTNYKTQYQLEQEKQRQLKLIEDKL